MVDPGFDEIERLSAAILKAIREAAGDAGEDAA
jgi:hypothetical protein